MHFSIQFQLTRINSLNDPVCQKEMVSCVRTTNWIIPLKDIQGFCLIISVFFLTDHPYITSEGPHVHQVQGGSRTSYPCPIDGNPPPDFKWYSGNGTSTLVNNGKNLSVSEKLSKNSGWYTCQATNKLGDKIIHLHLSGKLECCLQIN